MSVPMRLTGLGADPLLLRERIVPADAKRLAMRAIEVRFAAALVDSAMPKSAKSFGKGLAASIAREHLVNQIAQVLADSNALGIAKGAELRDAGLTVQATGGQQRERGPS
jgi:hypothetical protein